MTLELGWAATPPYFSRQNMLRLRVLSFMRFIFYVYVFLIKNTIHTRMLRSSGSIYLKIIIDKSMIFSVDSKKLGAYLLASSNSL
jgi:hypothetical protein